MDLPGYRSFCLHSNRGTVEIRRMCLYASIYDSRLMRLASNACLCLYSPSPFSARLLCLTIGLTRTATVQPYSHRPAPHVPTRP